MPRHAYHATTRHVNRLYTRVCARSKPSSFLHLTHRAYSSPQSRLSTHMSTCTLHPAEVVNGFGEGIAIPLPAMYVKMMSSLSVLQLDFIQVVPLACFNDGYNFYALLLTTT